MIQKNLEQEKINRKKNSQENNLSDISSHQEQSQILDDKNEVEEIINQITNNNLEENNQSMI